MFIIFRTNVVTKTQAIFHFTFPSSHSQYIDIVFKSIKVFFKVLNETSVEDVAFWLPAGAAVLPFYQEHPSFSFFPQCEKTINRIPMVGVFRWADSLFRITRLVKVCFRVLVVLCHLMNSTSICQTPRILWGPFSSGRSPNPFVRDACRSSETSALNAVLKWT